MPAPRWPIVVGIAALIGGGVWVASRGADAPPRSSPDRSAAPVDPQGSSASKAALAAPAGPALGSGPGQPPAPAAPPGGHPFGGDPVPGADAEPAPAPGPSLQQLAFGAQTRDVAWAGTTETEIKRRLGTLAGARLAAAECRQDQCELTIDGSTEGISAALATLESKRGLLGYAQSILLTSPEEREGALEIRVYARFDRGGLPAE